jgi:hypothetical protein
MLFNFYEKYIFRKLRLQSYRNTKKSEQKMLNNFKLYKEENEPDIEISDKFEVYRQEIKKLNLLNRNNKYQLTNNK